MKHYRSTSSHDGHIEDPEGQWVKREDAEKIESILTSYFYELVKDHITPGALNHLLVNAWVDTNYSDADLAIWAREHVKQLVDRVDKCPAELDSVVPSKR